MLNQKDLDFWIKNNLNVLFIGKHGCGKTTRIVETFTKHGLKWKYFSAATMDPWVDFVGIPKEKTDNKGNSYIGFVRPKDLEDDEVEAIFFDEFNRAPKKVLNAVMELIQFKSINGRKFNNLRFIWAAINQNDDDQEVSYHVESVDPAQLDRFQVQVEVPYELDKAYFTKKYSADIAASTLEWWKEIPAKTRNQVSPRRVDYALEIFTNGGNIAYALPKACNPHSLINRLSTGPLKSRFENLVDLKFKDAETKAAFSDVNFSNWVVQNILSTTVAPHLTSVVDHITDDVLSKLILENSGKTKFIEEVNKHSKGNKIIKEIQTAGVAPAKVLNKLRKIVKVPDRILEYKVDVRFLSSSTTRRTTFKYIGKKLLELPSITATEGLWCAKALQEIKSRTKPATLQKHYSDFNQVVGLLKTQLSTATTTSKKDKSEHITAVAIVTQL